MKRALPPHEKIRFRRHDIRRLEEYPSAREGLPPVRPSRRSLLPRRAVLAVAGAVLVLATLTAFAASWAGSEWLRREAQSSVQRMVGADHQVSIGRVAMRFAPSRGLVVDISDALIDAPDETDPAVRIARLALDLQVLPLLQGRFVMGSARLSAASLDLALLDAGREEALPDIFDDRGLIDPDAVSGVVFATLGRLLGVVERGMADSLLLEDIEIVTRFGGNRHKLAVREAQVRQDEPGVLGLEANLDVDGRRTTLTGQASSDPITGLIDDLSLDIRSRAPEVSLASLDTAASGGAASLLGTFRMRIRGRETHAGNGDLSLRLEADRVGIAMGGDNRLDFAVETTAELEHGSGKVEIERLVLRSGRSQWLFDGAVGPIPEAMGIDAYRFELVSNSSRLAPSESPEPTMLLGARLAGTVAPDGRSISANDIRLRSTQGEIAGRGLIGFEGKGSPGLELDFDVDGMPVAHVKQVWPWFAAGGARRWVLHNIFGGRISSGQIRLRTQAGRLGNGVPLGPHEVSGRFAIEETRFNVAGDIPPVRDGYGAVAFRGSDVDITLDSGTVYMPSGRTVSASGGTLTIREAHRRPVVGELVMDVAGEAPDVLELASYRPIAANRFIDLTPEDMTGTVTGLVRADIPLQGGIPVDELDWRVSLAYEDLAIDRPFQGQHVTEAAGTIVVDPEAARIEADARLNGAPSRLELVEPFTADKSDRVRRIALALDGEARRALAPGLNTIVSGLSHVDYEETGDGRRLISAELDESGLSLPWIGWSKGTGVPARASFELVSDDGRTELEDFRVEGESFSATGELAFDEGGIEQVRLPSARFHRDDDFSVDLRRAGRGYDIAVRGNRLDARSVIKIFTRESEGEDGSQEAQRLPLRIDLEVDAVAGFHGETMRGVRFTYSGSGERADEIVFEATTESGRRVRFTESREGGTRIVAMRSADAGAVLRFLDIYERMEGGNIVLDLEGGTDGPLRGHVDARDFQVVDEPRLRSITASSSSAGGQSLNQAVRGELDVSRVQFERAFTRIEKGTGYLSLADGVLRGPLVGATYQGMFYDGDGRMDMTGTFMPAYGLNRLFGELPIIGQILGNGRDRGLIGITFRLHGAADEPQLQVNPLSAIAPGIFRSVFEFR